jgi:hypothetical protein
VKRTFCALGTVVAVTYDETLASASLLEMMIGGYALTTEPATLDYVLARDRVTRTGFERVFDDELDLAPIFELDLYQQVVERAALGWVLHAAALVHGDKTIVLAGPSGAGKTTLTLALAARGARIITEEIVLIDRDLIVRGLARPIHLTEAKAPIGWRQQAYPMRGATGHVISAPPSYISEPRSLDALIRIEHGPELVPRLAALSSPIPRFWDCTLRQDDDGLATAVHILGRIQPQLLSTPTVDSAAVLLSL